jgi:hypothetical protein
MSVDIVSLCPSRAKGGGGGAGCKCKCGEGKDDCVSLVGTAVPGSGPTD